MSAPAPTPDPAPQDPPTPGAPATDPPTGTEPGQQPGNSDFDPSKLSDEDFNKLFSDNRLYRNPRFKSLSERAKKADELEQAARDAEAKALAEQGKFKELADKNAAEAQQLRDQLKQSNLNQAIQAQAAKLGIVDVEAASILLDKTKVTVNEDGSIQGVEDALNALVEAKPYLKGQPQQQPVGAPSNPNPSQTENGTKRFKLSQIQDQKFWAENEKDIQEALRLGLVEDDVHGTHDASQPTPQQT